MIKMCRMVCFLRLVSESPPCGARKTSALGGVRVRFSTVAETSYGFCDLRVIASGAGRDFMSRRWKKEQANLLRYIGTYFIYFTNLNISSGPSSSSGYSPSCGPKRSFSSGSRWYSQKNSTM